MQQYVENGADDIGSAPSPGMMRGAQQALGRIHSSQGGSPAGVISTPPVKIVEAERLSSSRKTGQFDTYNFEKNTSESNGPGEQI